MWEKITPAREKITNGQKATQRNGIEKDYKLLPWPPVGKERKDYKFCHGHLEKEGDYKFTE